MKCYILAASKLIMSPKECMRPPRHLLWMFLSITSVLAAALGWLGWQLLR